MSWSELNDWLAVHEIDPWGEGRHDLRSAIQAAWIRGTGGDFAVRFPHIDSPDNDEISVEDEAEIIAAIEAANRVHDNAATGTAESKADRIG